MKYLTLIHQWLSGTLVDSLKQCLWLCPIREHVGMTQGCHSEVNRGEALLKINLSAYLYPLLQDTQQEHSTEYYSMTKKLPNQIPHQRHQADISTVREVSWQVYSRKDQKPEVTKEQPTTGNGTQSVRTGNTAWPHAINGWGTKALVRVKELQDQDTHGSLSSLQCYSSERHNTKRVDWQSKISPDM